jgi:hypothetical protein
MTRGIIVWVLLMGLVSLEVCRWRIGVPLVIVWVLLIGLGGVLWVILNVFGDAHDVDDTRQRHASRDHHDGEELHDRSFRHSMPRTRTCSLSRRLNEKRPRRAGRSEDVADIYEPSRFIYR